MKTLLVILIISATAFRCAAQYTAIHQMAEREKRIAASRFDAGQTSVASNNFRVHYYECAWQVDPAVYYLQGKVIAHFIITQQSHTITFDLSHQLSVDSIFVKGQKINFLQSANESLTLNLPVIYSAGDTGSTTIFYHGAPPRGNAAFIQSSHNGVPIIWTLSEPYGAKDWWPCRNGLDDKADSIDVYITHPSQYKATSNGLLQSEVTVGNITTTLYKHRYPVASYLVAFAVTNYSVFTQQVQLGNTLLPVTMYVYPEALTTFENSAYVVINALKTYYECFGDYPFIKEKYGQTQFGYGGGMEHQTNSFISSDNPNLVAHELGHQWFGDKVTCGSWHEIWLNEGFAEYLADFLYTEKNDTFYYRKYVQYDLDNIVTARGGSVWVEDTTNIDRIFDTRLTYLKGAFLLRMLRWTLGDRAFFDGLRDYLNDTSLQYSFAHVSDLQAHLEASGNTNLNYFFNQWYYGQGYPSFNVTWQQNINNYAFITIRQTTSDPSVTFFKVPLALTFKNGTQSKTFIVNDSANNQSAVLDIGFTADTVLIDPDKQLISKNNHSAKLQPASTILNDIKIMPNPFRGRLSVIINNPGRQQWLFQVYNTEGKKLFSQNFHTPGADASLNISLPLNLPAGIYFLKIDAGDIHIVKKMIKAQPY